MLISILSHFVPYVPSFFVVLYAGASNNSTPAAGGRNVISPIPVWRAPPPGAAAADQEYAPPRGPDVPQAPDENVAAAAGLPPPGESLGPGIPPRAGGPGAPSENGENAAAAAALLPDDGEDDDDDDYLSPELCPITCQPPAIAITVTNCGRQQLMEYEAWIEWIQSKPLYYLSFFS